MPAAAAEAPPAAVILGGEPVGSDAILAIARDGVLVELHPDLLQRLSAARAVVLRALDRGDSVYGLTTGLGAAVDTRLDADAIPAFQARAIRARAVGVGEPLSTVEVRALLAARLVAICHGASGLPPALAETIAAMLNAGLHPVVRRIGSLGEADLSPLAQAFLPGGVLLQQQLRQRHLVARLVRMIRDQPLVAGELLRRGLVPARQALALIGDAGLERGERDEVADLRGERGGRGSARR